MEPKELKMDLAGRELKFANSPITTAATGYAIVTYGDTVMMANATISEKGREGADFFPMVVDYEENFFAAGKIKGSRFVKRTGRPSENSILISRMIDRPLRPLFPKGMTNEVQIICTALSSDPDADAATTAINSASLALMLTGAPFDGPISAVRMGYLDGKLIVNPTQKELETGLLDLVVAGTMDAIAMVEAAAKEVSEEVILEAFKIAHEEIKKICQMQIDYAKGAEMEKIEAEIVKLAPEIIEKVASHITGEMMDGVRGKTKKEVKKKIHEIEDMLMEKFAAQIEAEEMKEGDIKEALNGLLEKNMRKNILEKEIRLDGRKLTEIRQINIIPDVLPRTHGSAIFQRGETMALTITTLGAPGDAQIVDSMEREEETRRYFHHYNFPPFSVGEIRPMRGPGRREIGHGDLAERALVPVLPDEKDFGYTMWVVSEIVQCNGSSSMASVCGSTLSLMCAGVPIKRPVAGIAMGLVSDPETGKYKILSDIQGMEDFAGDMDFKVAGTRDGITALQMDIKVKGLSLDLMKEAMKQAYEGRSFIMDAMLKVVPEPKKTLSKYAPLIMNLQIDPEMIRIVIGKGGETIQGMTKEFGVQIDISDDGLVTVTAPDQESGQKAIDKINQLTYIPKAGETFDGKVTRLMEFGAFVEFLPGKEGLVHISELDVKRVNKVEDVVKVGDPLKVKLLKIDEQGRYNLSHKAIMGGPGTQHSDSGSGDISGKGSEGEIVKGTRAVRKVNGR
ncbi:polyribonucleotide nucleotidyltransferase [Candidatus Peregrinibacteria bacterium]|nr:polyribonucleotide nucleotidyltransferase [Candidatus Peregrinibacteria bacterium]